MNITVTQGNLANQTAAALVVSHFEGDPELNRLAKGLDEKLGNALRALIASGDFKGKVGEVAVVYPHGETLSTRVIMVGLGKKESLTREQVRQAAGAAAARAAALGCRSVASAAHGIETLAATEVAQAIAEGSELGAYQFVEYKSKKDLKTLETLTLVHDESAKAAELQTGARVGQIIGECTNFVRDLVNQPPNICTPSYLAAKAHQLSAAYGFKCDVLGVPQMRELGMGALLGVAQGSREAAQFIVMEYRPNDNAPVVLVGKGVTFDTGGYSIKTADGMEEMKDDMAGAGAVLGAVRAAAMLELATPVIGLVPATENMIGGEAYRPSDVLTSLSGKTIEVTNTDAEGRLILADALTYAKRYHPAAVIDLATLTGAAMIAFGRGGAAALFCDDDHLRQQLTAASAATGERVWPMPLYPDYREWMNSEVADIKNSAGHRYIGIGASAAFLKEFAEGYAWAHLDIAAMAMALRVQPLKPYGIGATGFGVRLLTNLLQNWV